MRIVLRALPWVVLVLSLPSVAADDDLAGRIRAQEALIGRWTQELAQIDFDLGESRIALWTASHPADVLAQHHREVARLDKAVAKAEAEKKVWEKRAGWEDRGFLGFCAWMHRDFIPYGYQAHGRKHREAANALESARQRRAKADREFERRLRDGILVKSPRPRVADGEDEGHVPRVYAQSLSALRVMALEGRIAASTANSMIFLLEARRKEKLARRRKAEAELHRLRFEADRRADPERVPPPERAPPPLELEGRVVGAVGHGKPEGHAHREQCTWKFRIRFTGAGDTQIKSWHVVSRRYVPAAVQHRHGPIRGLRSGRGYVEFGPDYLTVRKEDEYRGTYEVVFEFQDEYDRATRKRVVWQSPGRPPVGPPQSGLLGRFRGTPSAAWIRSIEEKGRSLPCSEGERVELMDWNPEPLSMELHASPKGPVARVSGARSSLRAAWVDPGGRGSLDLGLRFTFLDGARGPDGIFRGQLRVNLSYTAKLSDGTTVQDSNVVTNTWRVVPEDDGGRTFGLYFGSIDKEKAFSLVRQDG